MKKIYSLYTRRENKRLSAELNNQGAPSQEKKKKKKYQGDTNYLHQYYIT